MQNLERLEKAGFEPKALSKTQNVSLPLASQKINGQSEANDQ